MPLMKSKASQRTSRYQYLGYEPRYAETRRKLLRLLLAAAIWMGHSAGRRTTLASRFMGQDVRFSLARLTRPRHRGVDRTCIHRCADLRPLGA